MNDPVRQSIPLPVNPSWMKVSTLIRRIGPRGFSVRGKRIEVGEVVRVDAFTAHGLCLQGKAEKVEER